jgi:phenylacetate-coenzyme A ligase PaaK-like adenylate-forming protein
MMMERFDDLVTDRAIRLADAERYLAGADGSELFRGRYIVMSTSGSTGRRGVFVLDRREWIRTLASITRPIAWVQATDLGPRKKAPRSVLIAASAPWHFSARVGQALATRIVPTLRLDAATPVDEMVVRLNEWQPETMATYPSVLRELAAAQSAGRLNIPLRAIASSAEVLTAETRAAVRKAWGDVTLQDTYGATEYAPIATECLEGRKHLFENGALIEVVDDAGRAVPPGQNGARLLLTIFERRTQPLIRYEISDVVRLTGEACPCGRPYRTIESIEGRQEDVLYFARACAPSASDLHTAEPAPHKEPVSKAIDTSVVAVHPNSFHDTLERFATTAWQVVQGDDDLTIRVVGVEDSDRRDAIGRAVSEMLRAAGAKPVAVRVQATNQLARGATGKAPLIIARRPRSQSSPH